ncbi:MAG: hypothetical protein IGS49_22365 [Chlorogloeopsis fritschii C42_A2020_084]|uniref:hypothetical protein n=1 Tax=Chlorogloeopsis fritschii TaxID=1124 RepID=UPI0019F138F6|nr:hypothetical protein [Chlorogloeopsis fritschii]MBF2008112.1 hypothetical protein [Chlorogloeopsis fritschii C42_A2020_084]
MFVKRSLTKKLPTVFYDGRIVNFIFPQRNEKSDRTLKIVKILNLFFVSFLRDKARSLK